MDGEEPAGLRGLAKEAADAPIAEAARLHETTEGLERLTRDTDAWYTGTRARIEAKRPWSRRRS